MQSDAINLLEKTINIILCCIVRMISIELITRGESELSSVLESIFSQTFKDFEVVCANASSDKSTKELLKEYNCKIIDIPIKTGHLKARYLAHKSSIGERSLILDSTRPLESNALEVLINKYYENDMVIIREDSLGNGFWVNQAKKLKEIGEMQKQRIENETLAFLLPRFYRSSLLTEAFENIYKITNVYFDKISYGEHHLIFEACKKISNDVVMSDEILLSHYEDDSLLNIIRKYYRYGHAQKILKNFQGSVVNDFSSHIRTEINIKLRLETLPISIARGIPFVVGYILNWY